MALEPEGVPEAKGANPELRDMTRRFVIGAIFGIPIFVLEMGGHSGLLKIDRFVPMVAALWIQFILATPIVLWCAWPFFRRAWTSILNRSPNMFTLIALGVGVSYGYSVVAMFAPGIFPAPLRQNGAFVPVYYEAAAVVTVRSPEHWPSPRHSAPDGLRENTHGPESTRLPRGASRHFGHFPARRRAGIRR